MPIGPNHLLLTLCLWLFATTLSLTGIPATASDAGGDPTLRTNQEMLEDIAKPTTIDIQDLHSVFGFVFSRLDKIVRIYPTENYYYFSFYHGGIRYAGNLRLAAADRDRNILHFAYYAETGDGNAAGDVRYKALSATDGVQVTRQDAFQYRIGFGDKEVVFQLNDLSSVAPPAGLLRDDETYIGPVFDESGIELFLVFNSDRGVFHYLLNENGTLPEILRQSGFSERIVIGQRTAFAFYLDHHLERKVLIGVHRSNVRANNYLDGPFDQLPENFLESDTLKTAIEISDPSVKGRIDHLGYLDGGASRYVIDPYMTYAQSQELISIDQCASDPSVSRAVYPSCFTSRSTDQ